MLAYKSDGAPWPGLCNELAGEDNVKGVMVRAIWSSIERSKGVYDWSTMDAVVDACRAHNKDVFFLILEREFGGESNADRCLAPQYVKQIDNGRGCMPSKNGGLPAYHRPAVADAMIDFVQAIADRYDQDDAFGGIMSAESGPGFGPVGPPSDWTKAAYAEQLVRIYRAGMNSMTKGLYITGLGHLAGYETFLVDNQNALGAGFGGPDLFPKSCTSGISLQMQEYWTSKYVGQSPGMNQIQAPEMNDKWGPCSYSQLRAEIERLNLSYVFWLRKTQGAGITWFEDILPGLRSSPPSVYTACPSNFPNGCE